MSTLFLLTSVATDLKTASDAAHYLLEESKEPCKCLACDGQFPEF